MKKFLIVCSVLLILFSMCNTTFAMPTVAPSVYFDFNGDTIADPSIGPIVKGSIFSADLYIDGIGADEGGLISMQLKFTFDPTQITVNSLAVDISNWSDISNTSIGTTPGLATMVGGIFGDGLIDTIRLGSAQFECLAVGASNIVLNELYPSIPTFASFVSKDGTVFDEMISFGSTNVTQTPVPVPSTMLLLGTGLISLAGWGRRQFKKN